MPKTLPLNKHVTKKRGNNYGKVADYKHKRWARWGKVEGGGGDGAKVASAWTTRQSRTI